ncbi:hypothetical protein B0T18DRAFT_404231 [Schizothecium vesticola]|uniref:Transmembrane protein n=1 Tax=Schizothecium vesticola TaxID=314040 RepID=A0AA40F6P9_9PEZI|nr:hypothetical protein B0T18DRAFT_404231 [Schizothecium vesticola]
MHRRRHHRWDVKEGRKREGLLTSCVFFALVFSLVLAKTGFFFLFPCSFLSRRSVVWGRVQ